MVKAVATKTSMMCEDVRATRMLSLLSLSGGKKEEEAGKNETRGVASKAEPRKEQCRTFLLLNLVTPVEHSSGWQREGGVGGAGACLEATGRGERTPPDFPRTRRISLVGLLIATLSSGSLHM